MERDDVIAWEGADGPVTVLEVDAVRSVANALISVIPAKGGDQGVIRGFLFGIASEESEALAKMVLSGRRIRRDAGDIPVVATLGKGGA